MDQDEPEWLQLGDSGDKESSRYFHEGRQSQVLVVNANIVTPDTRTLAQGFGMGESKDLWFEKHKVLKLINNYGSNSLIYKEHCKSRRRLLKIPPSQKHENTEEHVSNSKIFLIFFSVLF